MKKMDNASVSVSVTFNDNRVREQFEANTKDTEIRIAALRLLKKAGIKTNALICPVIPFITDVKPLMVYKSKSGLHTISAAKEMLLPPL